MECNIPDVPGRRICGYRVELGRVRRFRNTEDLHDSWAYVVMIIDGRGDPPSFGLGGLYVRSDGDWRGIGGLFTDADAAFDFAREVIVRAEASVQRGWR